MRKKMVKRTIFIYLLVEILDGFAMAVHGSTYVIFLLSHNLNLFQVNLVNTIFMIALMLFELPTGIFADLFGRKRSVAVSGFICALGFLVYFGARCFWQFALAEIILALGMTFSSGAFQAWLVDSLAHYKFRGKLEVVLARGYQVGAISKIVACLVGASLANINLALPWLVAGLVNLALGCLVLVLMKENYFSRKQSFGKELFMIRGKAIVRNSVRYVIDNKNILLIILVGAGFCFACQAPNMQWQPYFDQFAGNKLFFGWITVGIQLTILIGATLAPMLVRICRGEKGAIFLSYIIVGGGLILTACVSNLWPVVGSFLVHEIGRGSERPIRGALLNKLIASTERATILSSAGMVESLCQALGLIISGWLALHYSIAFTWLVFGLIFVLIGGLVFCLKRTQ